MPRGRIEQPNCPVVAASVSPVVLKTPRQRLATVVVHRQRAVMPVGTDVVFDSLAVPFAGVVMADTAGAVGALERH